MTHGNDGKRNAAKPDSARADAHLHIRCKRGDIGAWSLKALNQGMSLSQWVIKQLNQKEK